MGDVCVVGAGLVGSLLSLELGRRGYKVDLYERMPDPRIREVDQHRSINLALSARGLNALRATGLEESLRSYGIPMRGRSIHEESGEVVFQAYGTQAHEYLTSIPRAWLNRTLVEQAEQTGNVHIHFQHQAVGFDFHTGSLTLSNNATGETVHRQTVTFAADGLHSAIRKDMMCLPRFDYSQRYLPHGYKEIDIPPGPHGEFQLKEQALHIWPRHDFMLIALPNPGGGFTGTIFGPFEGDNGFDNLSGDATAVENYWNKNYPDLVSLVPDAVEQYLENPVGTLATVRCYPWHFGGQACLLGDAAHAIVPFFGQGMNCGFEDVHSLTGLIDRLGPDWETVFSTFEKERKPNTDAIADMSLENFVEMRDKVADPDFLLRKEVDQVLEQAFPEFYVPRYSLVSHHLAPYQMAYRIGQLQERILGRLCEGLETPSQLDTTLAEELILEHLAEPMRSMGNWQWKG